MKAPLSLRRYLLLGILFPVIALIVLDAVSLYRQALSAINTAYDRTLLASAKAISESLEVQGEGEQSEISARVPYAALEAFEADNRSRMVYRVSATDGRLIDGFADLAFWRGRLPARGPYAALVDFYDGEFQGQPVRAAVLVQPVASERGRGTAIIQVAETLELRQTLTQAILVDTLWRQALLLLVLVWVVVWVVQRATQPVRELSASLARRPENDLSPLELPPTARELHPLLDAMNGLMQRLERLIAHRKRFVRDAAHQLRTPLAVLKLQVQSARRGDLPANEALAHIETTVDQATRLANQMLALAKVEQLRQQAEFEVLDAAGLLREVALEVSPLFAERDLDVGVETQAAPVRAHEWMLRELSRNLLHNAVKHSPSHGRLDIRVRVDRGACELSVRDCGPGLSAEARARLLQPFAAAGAQSGSGLGLSICAEIVQALNGRIEFLDAQPGLCVRISLPLADAPNPKKEGRDVASA